MDHDKKLSSPRHTESAYCLVSTGTLSHLATSLTILHGQVQLLQRRMAHGHLADQRELERAFTQMEAATRAMRTELHKIYSTLPNHRMMDTEA